MTPETPGERTDDKTHSRYVDGKYLAENPTWHAEDSPFKAKHVAKAILNAGIQPQSIAEVGCGAGGIIAELASRFAGAPCIGFEISEQAHALCLKHEGQNLQFRLGEFSRASDDFDVIVSCDVLEHVDDYIGFLRLLGSKSNHVVLNIPLEISLVNILLKRFSYARAHSGHLHYFTRETALASVEHAGLRVTDHFLAAGGIERAVTLKQRLAAVPRTLAALFGKDVSCRLFGGFSLIVVARGSRTDARRDAQ